MDLNRIGKFISERRKLKKLTQEQLSEKLNISDRAVSKWERGICLPDASIMLKLCEILSINVNELLSGEMLTDKEYNKKAEELLIELKRIEEEKDKLIFTTMYFLMFIVLILFFCICFIVGIFIPEGPIQLIIILSSVLVLLVSCFYALKLEAVVGYYECKHCHHKYKATYNQVLWAMHIGTTRYLKCPKCNKKSWSKKILTKENVKKA